MKRSLLSAIATFAVATPALAQPGFEQAKMTTTDLGDGIYMLTTAGGPPAGNIGISIGEDGTYLIDDQYAALSPRIEAELAKINEGDTDVAYIINTHFHYDHTNANDPFHDKGTVIVAHDNVRKRMKMPWPSIDGSVQPPRKPGAWPVITFTEEMTFHLNNQTAQIVHLPPAHTDGDSVVYFKEANILHGGDVTIYTRFPFADINGGGSVEGFIDALDVIIDLINDDTRIIPGHGPVLGKAQMIQARADISGFIEILKPLAESQQSVEEIVAARPLAGYESFAWSPTLMNVDQFTTIALTSMRQND